MLHACGNQVLRPDGGDGGRGGHIILRGNRNVWTLLSLKYRKHVVGSKGGNGEGGNRTGRYGEDVYLEVPLGTVAKDAETGEIHFAIGYSEPDAGSDLATLKTAAKVEPDGFVVNGNKLWTSGVEAADFVWLAARTDPERPRHKGISTASR